MNKIWRSAVVLAAACMISVGSFSASAQSSSSGLGSTIANVLQGVFAKSNLTVADIAGQWTSNGSAVSFQGDNFLEKAGGLAAAGVIENKLNPYYEKLGLNNAVLTIQEDGSFTMKTSKISFTGTITSNGDGTFIFNFKALGAISLGKLTTYVQKSGNTMDVMFDATKLKQLISGVASLTGVSIAKTAASLLDSYEGMCVGFSMTKTGSVATSSSSSSSLGSALSNILGGSKSNSTTTTTTEEQTTTTTNSGSSSGSALGNALQNILKSTTGK